MRVLVGVAVGVLVSVGVAELVLVGVGVSVCVAEGVAEGDAVGATRYCTCSRGAPAGVPSYDSATRSPVPSIMIASELPLNQPGRFTIC